MNDLTTATGMTPDAGDDDRAHASDAAADAPRRRRSTYAPVEPAPGADARDGQDERGGVPAEHATTLCRLDAYARGELGGRAAARIDAHLRVCASCAAAARESGPSAAPTSVLLGSSVAGAGVAVGIGAGVSAAGASAAAAAPMAAGVSAVSVGAIVAGIGGAVAVAALVSVALLAPAPDATVAHPTESGRTTVSDGNPWAGDESWRQPRSDPGAEEQDRQRVDPDESDAVPEADELPTVRDDSTVVVQSAPSSPPGSPRPVPSPLPTIGPTPTPVPSDPPGEPAPEPDPGAIPDPEPGVEPDADPEPGEEPEPDTEPDTEPEPYPKPEPEPEPTESLPLPVLAAPGVRVVGVGDDALMTLWGQGAAPGAVVEVVANGTVVARAGVDGAGGWSAFLVRPEPGAHAFAVRQARADGSGISALSAQATADVPSDPTASGEPDD